MFYDCTGSDPRNRDVARTINATSTRDAYLAFTKSARLTNVTVVPAPEVDTSITAPEETS